MNHIGIFFMRLFKSLLSFTFLSLFGFAFANGTALPSKVLPYTPRVTLWGGTGDYSYGRGDAMTAMAAAQKQSIIVI